MLDTLLAEAAKAHGIPLPDKPLVSNHFLRWGKGSRYSATALGNEGVYIRDFVTGEDTYHFADHPETLSPEQMQARKLRQF